MHQLTLRQDNKLMTTWVNEHPNLKVGNYLTLKKVDGLWLIENMYAVQEANNVDNRKWDNNNYDKHIGLFNK